MCFFDWKLSTLISKKHKKVVAYLVALSILFPKGIGIPIVNNVLDLNKIFILFSFFLVIRINKSMTINKYTLAIILFIFLVFLQSYSWPSYLQYFFFIYYIIFYFSAYFVGKSILIGENAVLRFATILSKLYLFFTPLAMLDYYLKFLPLTILRPFGEDFNVMKSRGEFGGITLDYYMGFDFNLHYFVFDRAVMFSLLFILLIFYQSWIKDQKLIKLFLVTITLLMIEIVLSQARFSTLFCGIFYLLVLFKYRRKITVIIILVTLLLGLIIFIKRIFYYVEGVLSLFTLIGVRNVEYGFKTLLALDKRYEAITTLFDKLSVGEVNLLSSKGPLFFNFHNKILGVKADNWDDVTPILNSILEFGFLPWLFLLSIFVNLLWANKSHLGKKLILLVFMVSFFTIPSFSPKFYYYFFFIFGGIVASKNLSLRYKN